MGGGGRDRQSGQASQPWPPVGNSIGYSLLGLSLGPKLAPPPHLVSLTSALLPCPPASFVLFPVAPRLVFVGQVSNPANHLHQRCMELSLPICKNLEIQPFSGLLPANWWRIQQHLLLPRGPRHDHIHCSALATP